MNIQELLSQTPVEEILEILKKRYTLEEEKRARFEATHRRIIRQILEMTPAPSQDLIVCDIYEFDGDRHLAVSMYPQDELVPSLEACAQLGQLRRRTLPVQEMEKALEQYKLPQSYSTLFVPWAEIAGCAVSPANAARYGQAEFLAAVLYEITFYGFDEETIAKEGAELLEASAEAKSDHTSIEELWKDLGMEWHEQTEEETQQEKEQQVKSLFDGQMQTYEVLQEIVKNIGL